MLGFRVPEGFDVSDIAVWRIIVNGRDIQLRDRIWVDPFDTYLWYIEGYTDSLSPYAIVTPEIEGAPKYDDWLAVLTGNQNLPWVIGILIILVISSAILFCIYNKSKNKEKE